MRYSLYDIYEDIHGDLIVTSDDMREIRMAAKSWIDDTDGECDLICKDNVTGCEVALCEAALKV